MSSDRQTKLEQQLAPAHPLQSWTRINTAEQGAIEHLRQFGVTLHGPDIHEGHEFLVRVPSARPNAVSIQLHMATNCLFAIEEPEHYNCSVMVIGPDNVFAACGTPNMPGLIQIAAEMHGAGNTIIMGRGSTSNGSRIVVQGGATASIGADCMFADGVTIRATDNHAMFDISTGEVLNPPADVIIGPHVWLGQEVLVLSGSRIGPGSVVGARGLVTRDIPAGVLAVGAPAQVVRSGIGWTRTLYPTEADRKEATRAVFGA